MYASVSQRCVSEDDILAPRATPSVLRRFHGTRELGRSYAILSYPAARVKDQINARMQIHLCSDIVLGNDDPNDYTTCGESHLSFHITRQNGL